MTQSSEIQRSGIELGGDSNIKVNPLESYSSACFCLY